MMDREQPVGDIVLNWTPRAHPRGDAKCHTREGQYCRLELLDSKTNETTLQQLFEVFKPTEQTHFTYLRYGPFASVDEFKRFVQVREAPSNDTILYTVLVNDVAVGFISYLRVNPEHGTIEIGNVNFSERLARTRQSTESIYLLMELAFDVLGYRRVEWKCNALNDKSRRAAIRLGYQYEGTWLKAEVAKGRSRDNAWYSMVDDEWPSVKREFQRWLNPANFDANEQQLTKLNAAEFNPRQGN